MIKKTTIALLVLAAATMGAHAEENEGWNFELAPTAWFGGISGETEVYGQKAEFDKAASDLFEALEFGGSLLGVAEYNRFVMLGRVDYFDLSTDALAVEDQPATGSTYDATLFLGQVSAGYRFDGWADDVDVDLLFGFQHLNLDSTLTVGNLPSSSVTTEIYDPVISLRTRCPIMPSKMTGLYFYLPISLGGGLGDSDFVYNVEAQLQYAFNSTVDLRVGYRAVGYQFTDDANVELDIVQAGWTAGLGFRF